jgi:hypothetical protein
MIHPVLRLPQTVLRGAVEGLEQVEHAGGEGVGRLRTRLTLPARDGEERVA